MRELAPGALLVNFTNPAGLITEALARHAPDVPSVGVCNVAITIKMGFVEVLAEHWGVQVDPTWVELDTLGLNHLSWHRNLTCKDIIPSLSTDLWSGILESTLAQLRADPAPEWDPRTIETLGMIPNYYLQYYYHTDRKLAAQEKWPPSRAEEVVEIEKGLLAQYAEPGRTEAPEELMKRGGAYYSTVATQLLNAHYNDLGETHVVNVRHNGAVPGWPADWVLEMPCKVGRVSIEPIPADPLPPVCFGLLAHVKSYEILTVEAAVHGDRVAARQALLVHPLGPPADKVEAVLDDMLEINRKYLPRFWGE
jgi:6-phospho-beta-glucosidase